MSILFLHRKSKVDILGTMGKRVTHYVSRKNPLVWLAAILMLGSVGLRIAYFCGKGADATTMWLQLILPVAASLIYCCCILLD